MVIAPDSGNTVCWDHLGSLLPGRHSRAVSRLPPTDSSPSSLKPTFLLGAWLAARCSRFSFSSLTSNIACLLFVCIYKLGDTPKPPAGRPLHPFQKCNRRPV